MTITMHDLDHVLTLAHLEIVAAEKETYLTQLSKVLQYMATLDTLDLTGIEPSSYASEQTNSLRDDILQTPLNLSLAMNAPDWENQSFRVPRILAD